MNQLHIKETRKNQILKSALEKSQANCVDLMEII